MAPGPVANRSAPRGAWFDSTRLRRPRPPDKGEVSRRTGKPLIHAALSGDGSFGVARWDARFVADEEDVAGQATCEGGDHLPLIGLVTATLARAIQDHARDGAQHDFMISLNGVSQT